MHYKYHIKYATNCCNRDVLRQSLLGVPGSEDRSVKRIYKGS